MNIKIKKAIAITLLIILLLICIGRAFYWIEEYEEKCWDYNAGLLDSINHEKYSTCDDFGIMHFELIGVVFVTSITISVFIIYWVAINEGDEE